MKPIKITLEFTAKTQTEAVNLAAALIDFEHRIVGVKKMRPKLADDIAAARRELQVRAGLVVEWPTAAGAKIIRAKTKKEDDGNPTTPLDDFLNEE